MPCEDGGVDSDSGLIKEAGCGGGQYVTLTAGAEPGQVVGMKLAGFEKACLLATPALYMPSCKP